MGKKCNSGLHLGDKQQQPAGRQAYVQHLLMPIQFMCASCGLNLDTRPPRTLLAVIKQ